MTNQTQSSGFVVFLKGLFKLILAILFGLIIGGTLYVAGAYIYQQAVIPSQNNAVAVKNMESRYTEQWNQLKERNTLLETRLTQLEINQTEQANQIDELQTLLSQNQTDYEIFLSDQAALIETLGDFEKTLITLTQEHNLLAEDFQVLNEQSQLADEEDPQEILRPLQLEIKLLKTMQQLNRSRLFILQSNYGLAKQEIELAMKFLSEMVPYASVEQQDNIILWQTRMEMISDYLPDQPILANEDMENLWQHMAEGFPQPEGTPETSTLLEDESTEELADASPTISPTLTPTPTKTP